MEKYNTPMPFQAFIARKLRVNASASEVNARLRYAASAVACVLEFLEEMWYQLGAWINKFCV